VRWIGSPGSDEPAATVDVVAGPGVDAHGAATDAPGDAAAPADADDDDDGGSDALAIAALVVAVLALLAAFGVLAATRRRAKA